MLNGSARRTATSTEKPGGLSNRNVARSSLASARGAESAVQPAPWPLYLRQLPKDFSRRLRLDLASPPVIWFLAIHGILALIFFSVPEIDLGFSSMFYTQGKGFQLGGRSSTKILTFMPWVTILFVNGIALLLVRHSVAWWRGGSPAVDLLSLRRVIYLAATLFVGPGFLVNLVLKHQFGRSRPVRVEAFSGERKFTAAFVMQGRCKRNCSFVSGDAAVGYYFFALSFLARRRRRIIAMSAYALGSAIGLVRIAQGAHFLSDIIFAGFFVILVAWLLSLILLPEDESPKAYAVPNFHSS